MSAKTIHVRIMGHATMSQAHTDANVHQERQVNIAT